MIESIKRKFLQKRNQTDENHNQKLHTLLEQSSINEIKSKVIKQSEPLTLNLIADEVALKTQEIAKKLSLECSCSIESTFTPKNTFASIELTLIKQLSNFSFEKYAEYIREQISDLIDNNQFILESQTKLTESIITISIVKI